MNKSGSGFSLVSFVLLFMVLMASLAIVAGFFASWHPALDSFSHLRVYLSVLMGAGSLGLLFTQYRREALLALVFAIGSFATTRDTMNGAMLPIADMPHAERTSYSLLQLNLLFNHPEPRALLQLLAKEQPDIITLQEVSSHWLPWLDILQGSYPYQKICKDYPGSWGVAILTKRPFEGGQDGVCVGDGILALTNINMGGTILTVGAVHLSWPWPFKQPMQMDYITPSLKQLDGTLILSGDFNATPWSAVMRNIAQLTGTYLVPGFGATWLTNMLPSSWVKVLGLQIDNMLISGDVMVLQAETLQADDFDHLPLLLRFTLPVMPSPSDEVPETGIVASLRSDILTSPQKQY